MAISISQVAAVVAVVVYVVYRFTLWHKRQQIIRQAGCQPMAKYRSSDMLGRDYDRAVKKSFQEGTVNQTAMNMYEKVGSTTYEVHTMNEHVVHTSEPLNLQAIVVRTDDWHKDIRKAARPWTGINNLEQNGPHWRGARDLINPLFKRAELKSLEYFQKFVDRALAQIPRDNSTIDLQSLLRKLFLDSSTEFIFGQTIDSLRDTTGKPDKLIASFNRALAGAGKRIRPTGLRLALNTLTPPSKDWLADCKVVHDYIDDCIVRHRDEQKQEKGDKEDKKRYVLIDGMSDVYPDPVELRFQLLGLFNSARETSAMGLSSTIFMLARNPDVWTELRQQAIKAQEDISFEELNSMSYFRYTVLEAFRLHAPITRIRRKAARDTVLPVGGGPDGMSPTLVPKGMTIWGDRYPKFRDPAVWGEDVEAFRPSRFEGRRSGWEFHPFSGGPRVCPASQQVVLQCMYVLFRLVREFEIIENRDPCLEYVEHALMCFESKNGCKVAFRSA